MKIKKIYNSIKDNNIYHPNKLDNVTVEDTSYQWQSKKKKITCINAIFAN